MNQVDRLYSLKKDILHFIGQMKSQAVSGYYRYSCRGDLYDESTHWNVGSSVFALKIYYTLGVESNEDIRAAAAKWLKANTDIAATVAIPDKRINFCAQREGLVYEYGNIPANVVYTVRTSKNQKDETALMEPSGKIEYKYVNKKKRGVDVIIYRNL